MPNNWVIVEMPNGRRRKLRLELCRICKKKQPINMIVGVVCLACRGANLVESKLFIVKKPDTPVRGYRSESYAMLKQATPNWVDQSEIRKIHAEARRLTKETGIKHHVDHLWPLSHESFCGLNVPWNLRIIPAVKNIGKGNTPPLAYLQQINDDSAAS